MLVRLGAVATFAACVVGGLVGFASSLLLLPVLLLLGVPLADAVTLNLGLAVLTRLPSVIALRALVDRHRTTAMLAGSVPGIAVGVGLAAVVPVVGLELAAGLVVLLSGLYLLWWPAAPPRQAGTRWSLAAGAGACSGALGVTTSLNGVPPAVLLARSGEDVRHRLADLSVFFAVGNCLVIGALAATGGLSSGLAPATVAVWLGAGLAGNAVGLRLTGLVDRRRFDVATTWLVLLSGAGSLVGTTLEHLGPG